MTPTDQSAHSSDEAACPNLVDETMNALSELLGRVELSEECVTRIIVAVRAITTEAAPSPPIHVTHAHRLSTTPALLPPTRVAPGKPLPKEAEVVPKQSKIPSGHYEATHNNVSFIVPSASAPEPFYLVTKGKMVGVFSSWENVSSLVSRVSGATYRRLQPGVTISRARQMMEKAIEDEVVTVIGQALVPPAVTL